MKNVTFCPFCLSPSPCSGDAFARLWGGCAWDKNQDARRVHLVDAAEVETTFVDTASSQSLENADFEAGSNL